MDALGWVAVASIFAAGIGMGIGAIGPALGEGRAIYCFVVAMILIFANPFWNYFLSKVGG